MENTFDLAIIGGGPGGYLAAERAAQLGYSVVLFEKQALGGVCLNEGCIPTKTLLHSAKIYEYALKGADYGVTAKDVTFDHQKVIAHKNKVVKLLVAGVNSKLKKHQVTVINAATIIAGKNEEQFVVTANEGDYRCDYLIIASGSQAIIPNIPGIKEAIDSGFVLTSKEILQLETLPESLTVVGGGVIGLEMAAYFNNVGVEVTVVEMLPSVGGPLDSEIAGLLLNDLQKRGIIFKLNSKVVEIKDKSLIVEDQSGKQEISSALVLMAVGRSPATDDLGLEVLNIYREGKAIVTDETLQTNVAKIYAIGDVNGKSMLAHTAYREAEVAVNNIANQRDTINYDAVPAVVYTAPEVAVVGESEDSAKNKGIDYIVKKLSMRYAGRFIAENEKADGLCKVLIERNTQTIIGIHMIGSYASEIIYGAAMMIETHWNPKDVAKVIFPHPTVGEILKDTIVSVTETGE